MVCGSFGLGAEGRLLACAQCGQCYHPFCVGIKVQFLMTLFFYNPQEIPNILFILKNLSECLTVPLTDHQGGAE